MKLIGLAVLVAIASSARADEGFGWFHKPDAVDVGLAVAQLGATMLDIGSTRACQQRKGFYETNFLLPRYPAWWQLYGLALGSDLALDFLAWVAPTSFLRKELLATGFGVELLAGANNEARLGAGFRWRF